MPFQILKNQDITKIQCDCIVNAANSRLEMGSGVCGAIFRKAGIEKLSKACCILAPVKTGEACITPGFDSNAKHIIHAVGPIYLDGKHQEEEKLQSCYEKSLSLAKENSIQTIAFPLISSGIYGYPFMESYRIAKETILEFLKENDDCMTVYLCVYHDTLIDQKVDYASLVRLPHPFNQRIARCCMVSALNEDKIQTSQKCFSELLFNYIDKSGLKDSEFYHRANMDRRLFSKLKDPNHKPSKNTILSASIALRLDLNDTNILLNSAGYTLSDSILFDCIIKYCIQHEQYDIYSINEILFSYDQPILG